MTTVQRKYFGRTKNGEIVWIYLLQEEDGTRASFLNYGATWHSMAVLDRYGHFRNVVLGYESVREYESGEWYLGATIGRVANRISGPSFGLNGKTIILSSNDNNNCLHGGIDGFNTFVWSAELCENGVEFSRVSPNGEAGFPGEISVHVKFSLCNHVLRIEYSAESNEDTVACFTNHAYFNFNGFTESIKDHVLWIAADRYTPVGEDLIPTGEIRMVEGTPFDFRDEKAIISELKTQRIAVYDNNFALNDGAPIAAEVYSKESGICLQVYTDQPGLQLYTPDKMNITGDMGGAFYGEYPALCLETQHFPDAVHHPNFPSIILPAHTKMYSITEYRFSAQ